MEEKLTVNGQEVEKEEFAKIVENAEKDKSVTLIEESEGEFVQRLRD